MKTAWINWTGVGVVGTTSTNQRNPALVCREALIHLQVTIGWRELAREANK